MVELVALSAMKQHLRVDTDSWEEDEYIRTLTDVAQRSCEKAIGQTVSGDTPQLTETADLLLVSQAMMLLVGGWYANRESVSSGTVAPVEMPLAVRWLLEPLRTQVA